MENKWELKVLAALLWRNMKWIVAGVLAGVLLALLWTRFLITPLYTSYIQLYCTNSTQSSQSGSISSSDITAARNLVDTYSVILKSDEVLDPVAAALGNGLTAADIRRSITLSSVDDTAVMQITATTSNPQLSADICTQMAQVAPEALKRIMKVGSAETIGTAKVASSPSSPSYPRNLVLGGFCGLVIVLLLLLVFHMRDNTVRGEEDIKQLLPDVPVLGEIPSFNRQPATRGRG